MVAGMPIAFMTAFFPFFVSNGIFALVFPVVTPSLLAAQPCVASAASLTMTCYAVHHPSDGR